MTTASISGHTGPIRLLADIPDGRDASSFVAHLMLATLSCHVRLAGSAAMHVARAKTIIAQLAGEQQTVRVSDGARLVRVSTRAAEAQAQLRLPVLDGVIIAPRMDVQTLRRVMQGAPSCDAVVQLCDIEIVPVALRLRTGRLASALDAVGDLQRLDTLVDGLEALLDQCLFPAAKAPTALELADLYFELALQLMQSDNQSLAALALQKAKKQVQTYAHTTDIGAHRGTVLRIAGLVDRLAATAS